MGASNNFGFFWGDKTFFISETLNSSSSRIIPVFLSPDQGDGSFIPDDLHITALLQKVIRDARIETKKVNVSIPAADTIIRSFVIPLMNANEIVSAVEFEAKKYIPFSLKDLYYSFYSVPVTENKIKKLRVIFVAIRKELIDRSISILSSVGIAVASVEPSAVSLVRGLLSKKVISKDQSFLILNITQTTCSVVFVQDGVVFYIREFQITSQMVDKAAVESQDIIKMRLLNELHTSLDFYNRQYMQSPIGQIIVISTKQENPYDIWLKEDLNIPVKLIDPNVMLKVDQIPGNEIGIFESFGASLSTTVKVKAGFNILLKVAGKNAATDMGFGIALFYLNEYLAAIKAAVVSLLILAVVYFIIQFSVSKEKAKADELSSTQSKYADMTVDDLQAKIDKLNERLKKYQSISLKNSMGPIVIRVSELLPEGAWLTTFNLSTVLKGASNSRSSEAKTIENQKEVWQLNMSGNVYIKDTSQEIKVVNSFLTTLKKDKQLLKYFSKFNLGEINSVDILGNRTISFSITGSQE